MATSEDLVHWNNGCIQCDDKNYSNGIHHFESITEKSSRILFNIAYAFYVTGHLHEAVENINACLEKDQHLCVGYYFKGILRFQSKEFESAQIAFDNALVATRGQELIDYTQLGLKVKVSSSEVMYNLGVAHYKCQDRLQALEYLKKALRSSKSRQNQTIITNAISAIEKGEDVTKLFELPPDAIYRPHKSKIISLEKADYLGKAKVIAAIDPNNTEAGFEAPKKRNNFFQAPGGGPAIRAAPKSPKPAEKNNHTENSYLVLRRGSDDVSGTDNRAIPGPPSREPPRAPKKDGLPSQPIRAAPRIPPKEPAPQTQKNEPEQPALRRDKLARLPPSPPPPGGVTSGPPNRLPPRPPKTNAADTSSAKPPLKSRDKLALKLPMQPRMSHSHSADDLMSLENQTPKRGENFPKDLDKQRKKTPIIGGMVQQLAQTLNSLGLPSGGVGASKSTDDLRRLPAAPDRKPPPSPVSKADTLPGLNSPPSDQPKTVTLPMFRSSPRDRTPSIEVTPPVDEKRRSSVDVLLPVRVKGAKAVRTTLEEFTRSTMFELSEEEDDEHDYDYTETYNLPAQTVQPKLPEAGNKPPLPPKVSLEKGSWPVDESVQITITCNKTKEIAVKPRMSLSELLLLTCAEFKLSRGTIDLWYKAKGKLVQIQDEAMMKDFWSKISDYNHQLWCYAKQAD